MSVRTDLATIESVNDRHVQRNNTMEREKKRLLNYLRSRKRGADDDDDEFSRRIKTIQKLSQFSHGQSNPTYKLVVEMTDGTVNSYVLRKKPGGKILSSAHAVEREFQVQFALKKKHPHFPVPRMVLLCEDSSILGTPFYIMDFVQGTIYLQPKLPDVKREERKTRIYENMAKTLGALHSFDVREMGLTSFGNISRGSYSRRTLKRWFGQYEKSIKNRLVETPEKDVVMKLVAWLDANCPKYGEEVSDRIIHGDYRLDNLIYDQHSDDVLAVLDWELSTIGCPHADVAYNCLPYYLPPGLEFYPSFGDSNQVPPGVPTEKQYCNIWSQHARLPNICGSSKWKFYVALSMFRGMAILAGVRARAVAGNASSRNARQAGSLVEVFAKRAYIIVVQGGASEVPRKIIKGGYEPSEKCMMLLEKLKAFMSEHVYDAEEVFEKHATTNARWSVHPLMEELKKKAKAKGLWNLWLPLDSAALMKITNAHSNDEALYKGPGLTNLEYAHLAREMGKVPWASEIFNCSAPDTGNMEVLLRYGTKDQQEKWLLPLLMGDIRSCFAMTEPAVASSDATNIESSIVKSANGKQYIVNGKKWWTSGACDPRCTIAIFMGKTKTTGPQHEQQSMVLIPMLNNPKVKVMRPLLVFGYDDAPHGHAEVIFDNVVVDVKESLLGCEGAGFAISQGRLGPGRLHHCMRLVGMAERSLDVTYARAKSRVAFGKPLSENSNVLNVLGNCRVEVNGARLLTLYAAHVLDQLGIKDSRARSAVAACKISAPNVACSVIDRCIQLFGGEGVSQDSPLARLYAGARTLRIADGPDEVHLETVAKIDLRRSKL